jgi:HK97 family phage portal protein
MGLMSYIRGDDLRGTESRSLTRASVPPVMLQSTPGGAKVTPESALSTADAYSCIRCLADAAASLPLHVYRRTGDGRERVEGRTAELLRRPSPATTQANLIGQLVGHLNTTGDAYLGKFRDSEGNVDQLALLHPERVVPEIKGGRPIYTVTGPKGEKSVHGISDIVHIRGLSIDGVAGLSPVSQCRVALGLSAQLAEHAASFFENDARPTGILRLGNSVAEEQLAHLRAAWDHRHQGTRNAHRTAVVSGDIDFQPVSMSLDDAQFLEQRRLSATEVARIFRVPPWMVGASGGDSMTYSNTESQALAFATYSLRPHLTVVEQALSADEDLFPGPLYAEFVMDALLRADSSTRAAVYTAALNRETGWMTRAEVRRLENLAPEDDAAPVAPERNSTNV